MTTLAVLVEFEVKSEQIARFRELIVANARQSLQNEPGCQRFDVLAPPDDPRRIILYEIYESADAFDVHLETQHYKTFATAIENIVDARSVQRLQFLELGRQPDASDA